MLVKNPKGFYEISTFKRPKILHAISTRAYGNMSYKYGLKTDVDKNRQKLSQDVGFAVDQIAALDLIHGTVVSIVKGAGISPATDGGVTNIPGLVLWVVTADCAPIIFFDPKKKVVGIAHSGWRGTVGKIALKVVGKMVEKYGCNPSNVQVGFGPTIGKCCYSDNLNPIQLELPEWNYFITKQKDGKYSLDINAFTKHELKDIGIREENIDLTNFCTMDHEEEFFSSQIEATKKESPARFATLIALK